MIRLRTLGSMRLESPDGEEAAAVLAQPKRFALLVYLTIAQPRGPRRRDTLLAMFWPELDQSRARHALSQSLHFLRQRLGADVIVAGAEDVAVDPEQIGCDVHDFDRAIADGQLERALDLYQGDFLSRFHLADAAEFEQWADGERTRLRVAAIGAAHRCAERAISGDRALEGVTWASRALALDP